MTSSPRIAIPEPTSTDPAYNQRSWRQYADAIENAGGIAVQAPLSEQPAALARIANSCSGVLLPGSAADVDPEKYGAARMPKCGPKDGVREAADDLLLQDAFHLHKPILGICYGLQSLNVWRNGSLIQDLGSFFAERSLLPAAVLPTAAPTAAASPVSKIDHKPGRGVQHAHSICVAADSRLARVLLRVPALAKDVELTPGQIRLSVNSSHHQAIGQAGDRMRVVARSPDGVIEALEDQAPDEFVLGVQWHPERTYEASPASRAIFEAFVQAAGHWAASNWAASSWRGPQTGAKMGTKTRAKTGAK